MTLYFKKMVKYTLLLKEVTTPERIVLSRNIGAQRYYGRLDIMKVNNQKVAIVQRLADKNGEKNLENQDWKIIWIDEKII